MTDLTDDLYSLVRFPRDPTTGMLGLVMPSQRDVAREWKRQGIRAPLPEENSPLWAELLTRAAAEYRLRLREPRKTTVQDKEPARPRVETASGAEAEIRQMKGALAVAECTRLQVKWPGPHPSNPGITAMRAKNALLAFVKGGGRMRAEEPALVTSKPVRGVVKNESRGRVWSVSDVS